MRWYSLLDHRKWTNEYYSPVGDTTAQAKVIAYNPNSFSINVKYEYYSGGVRRERSMTLNANRAWITDSYIPDDSGARFWTENPNHTFFAVSNTDTLRNTGGQIYDWGFPLIPSSFLSEQILVGWGYGCTANVCSTFNNLNPRSVVYVSPVEDATLYIDYDNDYTPDRTVSVTRLSSTRIVDMSDTDMTGATVYAKNSAGEYVQIAAAWGQHGALSRSNDDSAQDLGTAILPFHRVQVSSETQVVNANTCIRNRNLKFRIRIKNVGPSNVAANQVEIKQALPAGVTYVAGSTKYTDASGTTAVPDNAGSSLPLIAGKKNLRMIPARTGEAEFTFEGTYTAMDLTTVVNTGTLSHVNGVPLSYYDETICDGTTADEPPGGFSVDLPPLPLSDGSGCPGSATA